MDEHVLAAALRLDEPVPLSRIEPLDRTMSHVTSPVSDASAERAMLLWAKAKKRPSKEG
jgi:hypothetical protein